MCSPRLGGRAARARVLEELAELTALVVEPPSGNTVRTARELMREIRDLCVFADRVHGHLARLTAALDAAGGAAQAGHASAAAFLRGECGRNPARAGDLVALGRGLRKRPATAQALDDGRISADAALIVTRSAGQVSSDAAPAADGCAAADAAERVLLDAAESGVGASQLRELGDEVAYRADPAAADDRERKRWLKRYLSFGLTLDGVGVMSGACGDTASFEVVRTAADAFAPPGGVLDTRTAAQRRLDGLVAACQVALDSGRAPGRHRTCPHVSVLVRDETLAGVPGAPPGRTGHGALLTAQQVLALCCGAELTAIRWHDGLPLDVGRASRTEPPGLRKALEARDLTCRWPGCDAPGVWCTGHHIRPWQEGAHTRLAELVLLCWVHHMHFVHRLGWTIKGDPGATLYFRDPAQTVTLESPLPGRARAP